MGGVILIILVSIVIGCALGQMIRDFSGMTKRHNETMERLNISFIHTIQETNQQLSKYGIHSAPDSILTYFVPCYPGIYNKLQGNIKMHLYTHEYNVTKEKIDKSRQFLVVSKEQFFLMQLKGWIGTTDRKLAVKAISYLKEVVSLP